MISSTHVLTTCTPPWKLFSIKWPLPRPPASTWALTTKAEVRCAACNTTPTRIHLNTRRPRFSPFFSSHKHISMDGIEGSVTHPYHVPLVRQLLHWIPPSPAGYLPHIGATDPLRFVPVRTHHHKEGAAHSSNEVEVNTRTSTLQWQAHSK